MTLIERLEAPHKAPEPYQSLGDLCLEAEARIRELEAALRDILPGKLCGEDWKLPDDETVSIVITFGKLAKARALLTDSGEP